MRHHRPIALHSLYENKTLNLNENVYTFCIARKVNTYTQLQYGRTNAIAITYCTLPNHYMLRTLSYIMVSQK